MPVLVLANKQDVPGAMTADEVAEKMQLETLFVKSGNAGATRGMPWKCVGSTATQGILDDGVQEGMRWLMAMIDDED